jgi:GTPase SAR1 family protein
MAPMFYRNANAALIVFDITSAQTFESMQGWVLELKKNVDNPMVLCVVGNKIDLAKNRQVKTEKKSNIENRINCVTGEQRRGHPVRQKHRRHLPRVLRHAGSGNCDDRSYEDLDVILGRRVSLR